jgi:hypothetical protein
MGAIEKLGYDGISKRDLFVLEIPSSEHLPAELSLTTPRFVCLIAWNARNASVDEISRVAVGLLRQGAVYVCAWGPNCERVHDIIDEEHVGPNPSSDESGVVMTTCHAKESLAEAIRFALVDAWPDEFYAENCGSTLGVAIGSSSWAAEIRTAFSSPEQFVQHLDSEV